MDEVAIVEDILYSQYEDSSYQDLANIPLPSFYHCGIWQELKAGLPAEQVFSVVYIYIYIYGCATP